MSRSTIYDVAAEAGVSTSTVSRVLNASPLVADPTRRRVLSAMHRLKYRPDDRARALAASRFTPRAADGSEVPRDVRFEGAWSPQERAALLRATGWGERRSSAPEAEAHWVCVASLLDGLPVYLALRAPGVEQPVLAGSAEALARKIVRADAAWPAHAHVESAC